MGISSRTVTILCYCTLSLGTTNQYLYANDYIDINTTKYIEVIQYSNQKSIIKKITNYDQEPIYYTPQSKVYNIKFQKSDYQTKYGKIKLYDISKKNKYLNAINYDHLIIDGNISNCQIAISDRRLFQKEDNIKLKVDNNIIDFKDIYQHIDLTKLKYLILFDNNDICQINKLSLTQNNYTTNYNNFTNATWIWNPDEFTSSTKLKHYNINTLYIQLTANNKAFINILKSNIKYIYGLNGSPSDIYNHKHLLQDIKNLSLLKQTYPNIQGYQVDIEPYLLKEYNTKPQIIIQQYIKLLKDLKTHTQKHNLKFSVVIPFWYSQIYYKNRNLAQIVLDIADEVVVMSYRSDLEKVLNISQDILRMGIFAHKKVKIGIELMAIDDEKHTIYKTISNVCLKNNHIDKKCISLEPIRSYTIKGSSISFHNQIEKLQGIDTLYIPYQSFNGFVLHHYSVLPKY